METGGVLISRHRWICGRRGVWGKEWKNFGDLWPLGHSWCTPYSPSSLVNLSNNHYS